VRFAGGTRFACRLVGASAEPLRAVKTTIQAPNAQAVQAPQHPEHLGANLGRTLALLESGKYTHRPVRIVFWGQSIESDWTRLLIQRLRERYPGRTIVAENRAVGGWFVFRMQTFTSNSGRITILAPDSMTEQVAPDSQKPAPEMKPFANPPQIVWHILPDCMDEVPEGRCWQKEPDYHVGHPTDDLRNLDAFFRFSWDCFPRNSLPL
jgi:hypothetical protein